MFLVPQVPLNDSHEVDESLDPGPTKIDRVVRVPQAQSPDQELQRRHSFAELIGVRAWVSMQELSVCRYRYRHGVAAWGDGQPHSFGRVAPQCRSWLE